ncbi:hypothetical protein BAAM0483_04975 [Bifidobacterium animalis subsp. animalis MCC 0483]|uniref:Uncharacterized protein n=1 Tax=Bifidobacterium animalis subsp. animalis MCC 0483 TaxID=1365955 RepID=A0AB34T9E8_9BIFI|nr:hypothetical protein [Bifidobacterium animalis]KOA49501.1 hypothetical protein BAAM0483_04975 [Bifidobacterium animalis subsp. animalis MCC 0483]
MTIARRPKGSPNGTGGQFAPTQTMLAGTPNIQLPDTPPAEPMPVSRIMDYKNLAEQAARTGDMRQAVRYAHRIGAVCPAHGDRLPYGTGTITMFDGHRISTGFCHGGRVVECTQFRPDMTPVASHAKPPRMPVPDVDVQEANLIGLRDRVEQLAAHGDMDEACELAHALGAWTPREHIPDSVLVEGTMVNIFDGRTLQTAVVEHGELVSTGGFRPDSVHANVLAPLRPAVDAADA